MAERWTWEPIGRYSSGVKLIAPSRYAIGESGEVARVVAKADEDGGMTFAVTYLDADGTMVDGEGASAVNGAKRNAATLALEARIEWAHRQMLAARQALDAGHTEEALALLAGADRQLSMEVQP